MADSFHGKLKNDFYRLKDLYKSQVERRPLNSFNWKKTVHMPLKCLKAMEDPSKISICKSHLKSPPVLQEVLSIKERNLFFDWDKIFKVFYGQMTFPRIGMDKITIQAILVPEELSKEYHKIPFTGLFWWNKDPPPIKYRRSLLWKT